LPAKNESGRPLLFEQSRVGHVDVCPAGSLLIFAGSTTHSTAPWTSAERDRVAIFSRYNHVNSKWHKWQPHPEFVAGLPPKRRTLFRPIHVEGNLVEV
jgi:hypothetical protein